MEVARAKPKLQIAANGPFVCQGMQLNGAHGTNPRYSPKAPAVLSLQSFHSRNYFSSREVY
jgi:hypothetical protein